MLWKETKIYFAVGVCLSVLLAVCLGQQVGILWAIATVMAYPVFLLGIGVYAVMKARAKREAEGKAAEAQCLDYVI